VVVVNGRKNKRNEHHATPKYLSRINLGVHDLHPRTRGTQNVLIKKNWGRPCGSQGHWGKGTGGQKKGEQKTLARWGVKTKIYHQWQTKGSTTCQTTKTQPDRQIPVKVQETGKWVVHH